MTRAELVQEIANNLITCSGLFIGFLVTLFNPNDNQPRDWHPYALLCFCEFLFSLFFALLGGSLMWFERDAMTDALPSPTDKLTMFGITSIFFLIVSAYLLFSGLGFLVQNILCSPLSATMCSSFVISVYCIYVMVGIYLIVLFRSYSHSIKRKNSSKDSIELIQQQHDKPSPEQITEKIKEILSFCDLNIITSNKILKHLNKIYGIQGDDHLNDLIENLWLEEKEFRKKGEKP
jgi:uncharacterized Tic20 family protein